MCGESENEVARECVRGLEGLVGTTELANPGRARPRRRRGHAQMKQGENWGGNVQIEVEGCIFAAKFNRNGFYKASSKTYTMHPQDIAIIGLAGRFPGGHNDIYQFQKALERGEDCVLPISKRRVMESTLPLEELDFQVMGFLEDVDKFDHTFFNVSHREAEVMDPHQRLMMEVAYETFESAGQRMEDIAGSKTGIVIANADYEYHQKFVEYEQTMFTGNSHFATAGRLARFFKLHGPSMLVDTGCSATLMSVVQGVGQLQLGNAPQVLVIGCRVILSPQLTVLRLDVGASSFDGKTRSFTEGSRGSGSAEMVGAVLLKPLEKALADGDPVYAVIKAAHSNTSAERSASLTATSSAAETELLLETWAKAGIEPRTVTCIEAHGSGTQLGDPIEISAIDAAFRKTTSDKHFCAVTCVKTNIGHTDKLSGMAGLIKGTLMLKNKALYPLIHFTEPSSYIDFENSATYINTEHKAWVVPDDVRVRRMGVSSFGFAGNNTHVLLEEGPEKDQVKRLGGGEGLVVAVSGKSKAAARRNMEALLGYLKAERPKLEDVSFTTMGGRSHYKHRYAWLADNYESLLRQMEGAGQAQSVEAPKRVFLLLSGDELMPETTVKALQWQCPQFKGGSSENRVVRRFEELMGLYELVKAAGIPASKLLGFGIGEEVVNVITGVKSKADALKALEGYEAPDAQNLGARMERFVDRETEHGRVMFVDLGGGALGNTLSKLPIADRDVLYSVVGLEQGEEAPLASLARALYLEAVGVDWKAYSDLHWGEKIWLPPYQFEKTRCWVEAPYTEEQYAAWKARVQTPEEMGLGQAFEYTPADGAEGQNFVPGDDWSGTEAEVGRIWAALLNKSSIGRDDDFFALGGHSLIGTMMINRIEKAWGVRLLFKDIFAYSTIRRLAAGIDALLAGEQVTLFTPITRIADAEDYAVSHSQKRLWILWQLDPHGLTYNLPEVHDYYEDLDTVALERAFQTMVARHESLRTGFKVVHEEPRQFVLPRLDFPLAQYDLRGEPDPVGAAQAHAEAVFGKAFDLGAAPLFRVRLVRLADAHYQLLLVMHHIISDGWSMQVIVKEVMELYAAYRQEKTMALPELPIHYRDFAAWQNAMLESEAGSKLRQYWTEKFARPLGLLELPLDHARGAVPRYEGHAAEFWLDAGRTAGLRGLGKTQGATLYMMLLASFQWLLRKYHPGKEVVVGTPMAGRGHNDLESQVGFYVNTVPILTEIGAEDSFQSVLARVKQSVLEALEYQDYPMDKLIQEVVVERDMARNPLFDVFFALLVPGTVGVAQKTEGGELAVQAIDYPVSKFDLELQAYDHGDQVRFTMGYKKGLFRWETVKLLCEQYVNVVDAVLANPGSTLQDLQLMNASARAAVTAMLADQGEGLDVEFDF